MKQYGDGCRSGSRRNGVRALLAGAALLLALTAGCGGGGGAGYAPTSDNGLVLNTPAADFKVRTLDGELVTLSEFRGTKPVLLNFYQNF